MIDDCLYENSMSDSKELILQNEAVVKSVDYDSGENDEYCLNNQVQGDEIEETIVEDEEIERNIGFTISEDEEKQIWSNGDFGFGERVEVEEEGEGEGGNRKLSTEELNKKFDDFIKKMKTELRMEAQRQLIMV